MTKKDYVNIAIIVRHSYTKQCEELAELFQDASETFNWKKFMKACGLIIEEDK